MSNTFTKRNPDPETCYDPPGAEDNPVPCAVAHIVRTRCETCHADGFDLDDRIQLESMLDRLTSADNRLRMPKNQEMPDVQRVKIVEWLTGHLENMGGDDQ